ncbi:MAG: hypothetical protein V4517_00935 [Pseudomonadota bacterium]
MPKPRIAGDLHLSADRIRLADLLRALLVPRLLLSPLVANDTLILRAGWRQFRLWHTLLPTMLAALILHTFQIIFLGHRDITFFRGKHFKRSTQFDATGFHE